MDPGQALAELKQISAQVQDAVIFDESGSVVASTVGEERAPAMARAAQRLLEHAGGAVENGDQIVQIEAALPEGSVIVAREGGTAVAATTVPDPTVGLIFYDLRTCLRSLQDEEEKPKPKPRRKPPAKKKEEAKEDDAA
jgi:predicted regulator of Ras-like GTPase activity (Roadblock/LC7/MglB family)